METSVHFSRLVSTSSSSKCCARIRNAHVNSKVSPPLGSSRPKGAKSLWLASRLCAVPTAANGHTLTRSHLRPRSYATGYNLCAKDARFEGELVLRFVYLANENKNENNFQLLAVMSLFYIVSCCKLLPARGNPCWPLERGCRNHIQLNR